MKTVFYLDGKKITRKDLNELVGRSVVRELVNKSKETLFVEHQAERSFNMGSYGIVKVCLVQREKKNPENFLRISKGRRL